MVVLIIATIVVAVLLCILLSSVKVSLQIDDGVALNVYFSLFKVYSLKPDKKAKKTANKIAENKANKNGSKQKISDVLKKYAKSRSNFELIEELFNILRVILSKFKKLLSHTHFDNVKLFLSVASDDAAQTAILYGRICSVIYPCVEALENFVHFSPKNLSVKADFSSEKPSLSFSCVVRVRAFYILCFIISLLFTIIKNKIGDTKNGRS